MSRLEQRKLFVTREFEITEKGLKYKFKNLTSSLELEIPFEEIGTKRIDQKLTSNRFLAFALFMSAASLAKVYYLFKGDHTDYIFTLVVVCISILLFFVTYYLSKESILLESVNPPFIEFYSKRPDEHTVEDFIHELQLTTKNYLIKKYAERDLNIPVESQLETISLLKNRNIINEKEYEELTNRLTKPNHNPIGFGHHTS